MLSLSRCAGAGALVLGILVASARAESEIPVVDLVGVVHAVTAAHVTAALERAESSGAPLVIVQMDTPGGFDTAMRQIVDSILSCRTPVAVFVGPSGARGASAGFVILVAADIAAMAPGTNTGAAHPVLSTGQMDETMSKKVTSDAAAYIRGKAERRGRNVEMAEKAVVESRSFTEKEALDARLIDLIATDVDALVVALDGREVTRFDGTRVRLALKGHPLVRVKMQWHQAILAAIAHPGILFLLVLGALAGLGTEISHPGFIFPGIVGTVCLILFLFATQVIPINWAGILFILLAVGLFVAEVKVASYGLLTVGGIVAMILGAMMLVDNPPVPEMRVSLMLVIPAAVALAAWASLLVRMVLRAQSARVTTGAEGMVGEPGLAETGLDPDGWVRLRGERWRARAEAPVAAGERVLVVAVQGLTLRVRKEVQ